MPVPFSFPAASTILCGWAAVRSYVDNSFVSIETNFWIGAMGISLLCTVQLSVVTIVIAKKHLNNYRFQAKDGSGEEVEGTIDAASKEEAQQKLKQEEYFLTKLDTTPFAAAPRSRARWIALAAAKAFFVAIASALGAKFGSWLGGVIAATIAGTFAVATGDGHSDGASNQPG